MSGEVSEEHKHGYVEEGGEIKESEIRLDKEPVVEEKKEQPKIPSIKVDKNDILRESYDKIVSMSTWKKIHWSLAIIVTTICIFVWRYAVDDPSESFWWWIIPMFGFTISLILHYSFVSKKYEDGIVKATIVLNILLYLSNILSMDTDDYVFFWWVYPAILSAMIVVPYYKYATDLKSHKAMADAIRAASPTAEIIPHEINWYRLAVFEYACISLALFITWVNVKLGHPWFFYPILALASPLIYWRMRKESERRLWVLAIPQLILLNLIVFIAWAFTSSKIPWFVPVFVISCFVVGLLWFKWKRDRNKINKIKELEINLSKDLSGTKNDIETTTPQESTTEPPQTPEEVVIQ